ncbi:MAG: hypothetical protein E7458_00415 [Ruminococcaceae bacterium]|nr:hypothetical protein [Oscillospiraceae bacterium]
MTEFLRNWVLGIVAVSLTVSAVSALAGEGPLRRMVRLVGALLLLLSVLLPWKQDGDALLRRAYRDWDAVFQTELAAVQAAGTRQYEQAVRTALEEQAVALAAEQGIACSARIELEFRDGIPVPLSCRLFAGEVPAEQAEALCDTLRQMLGTDQITIQKE